ncbi:hypothetical protein J4444_00070 [Candidatus Woesearchaeota archaeon]|nr:hypothetical protein [Candidatus Woesearchaeota archaeon]
MQDALKEVYSSKKYLVLTAIVTIFLFLFNILVNNYRILFSDFSFSLLLSLLSGTLTSMKMYSILLLCLISILAGIVVALSVFLVKKQIKGSMGTSLSTIIVSLITPTCPSCAMGFLSVMGFGGFLAILPFKGLELGLIGIGILGTSVIYLSNKITNKTCNITSKARK